jgi:nicotinate-nucleotide adenylyltransferase
LTGLFGGTFDPPHNGHLALARAAVDRFGLERLVVTVGGQTPGKETLVDAETRLRLTEAAFADVPRVEISRMDIDREQPAYSHETVRRACERWGEIVFLVGADRFADFLDWKAPNEVLQHARLGVATRPGVDEVALRDVLEHVERPEQVTFFPIGDIDVSSSDIRRRIAAGEAYGHLVPAPVARLIEELRLYRDQRTPAVH